MIRLSKMTDYGIVLMAHLAQAEARSDAAGGEPGGEPHNAREVANGTGLPLPVVSKILKCLAREGLLVSLRGARGGYSLARRPREVTAADMIAALEGPIGITECSAHPGQCSHELSCHMREPWQRINRVLWRALSEVTLADLAHPPASGLLAGAIQGAGRETPGREEWKHG